MSLCLPAAFFNDTRGRCSSDQRCLQQPRRRILSRVLICIDLHWLLAAHSPFRRPSLVGGGGKRWCRKVTSEERRQMANNLKGLCAPCSLVIRPPAVSIKNSNSQNCTRWKTPLYHRTVVASRCGVRHHLLTTNLASTNHRKPLEQLESQELFIFLTHTGLCPSQVPPAFGHQQRYISRPATHLPCPCPPLFPFCFVPVH